MEEWIGKCWHGIITRAAGREFSRAAVHLEQVRRPAGVLFRALGGDKGLRIESASDSANRARRSLLARLAGSEQRLTLAWRDGETLRLPPRIAHFPHRELNRDLYLWLAALAARPAPADEDWLTAASRSSAAVLARYPGLAARYRRLVTAHLALRPDPDRLKGCEAEAERRIRTVLEHPGQIEGPLPACRRPPQPVPLWLHPEPPRMSTSPVTGRDDGMEASEVDDDGAKQVETERRLRGERGDMPGGQDGLLAFRLESLFTRAEYAKLDRSTEEDFDHDSAGALEDLDTLALARDHKPVRTRLRFDLDLPPETLDDLPLGPGIALPEWDWKQQRLLPGHCRLQPMLARDATPAPLPPGLRSQARRLRRLFEQLQPIRHRQRARPDGSEPDLDALIAYTADRLRGRHSAEAALYQRMEQDTRDLACLLLADLSLSTDAHVDDSQRVIDVIRDSLLLFAEALAGTGDRFALYGFSSRRRSHVRFQVMKPFDTPLDDRARGRIQAIRPGYYTRMGAAIRYATRLIERQPTRNKLLLLLTDGKPNDLDHYEGRYGIEDTRHAIREALEKGVRPFCVSIDEKAGDYLSWLFGNNAWIWIRNARELPRHLPLLYARLTGY
ncbi:MAG TPA: VWA domain-containing protein [Gammaproteobacteria bacterium]|nr:VWA domain-containing protein [Gammaproteobacteria bacterium]